MGSTETGSTRERLLDAGAELLDHLPLDRLLAGVPTAAVAEAAGVTTGAFFHHFPTAADFARALVLRTLDDVPEPAEVSGAAAEALARSDLVGVVKAETRRSWERFSRDPQRLHRFRVQLHLAAHHRTSLGPDGGAADGGASDVGDVLQRLYRARAEAGERGYAALFELLGTEPVPPFTLQRASTALTALFDGLLIRHAFDPEAVDDELYADICGVVTSAVHRPAVARRRRTEELAGVAGDEARSPQARSGVRRRRDSRQRISVLATGMFDAGWEEVAASDVAERAGVATQTVFNLFGSVRSVAALTFARHVPTLRTALESADLDTDPVGALRAVLARLATEAADDPGPARALLEERLVTALTVGADVEELDIRLEVPLVEVVGTPLGRLDLGGRDLLEVATSLVNTVLVLAVPGSMPADEVAGLAVALLPPSAGGGAADGM